MQGPTLRLGVIGADSSHVPEFTRRLNLLNDNGTSRCRVTAFYDPGDHALPPLDVAAWRNSTLGMGVTEHASLDEMLGQVDGVLVLAVDGHRHAGLALPPLRRGLPTYIDKPLTCDLAQARHLLETAREHAARCYSASSLRFADEITRLDRNATGPLQVVSAFGPGELNAAMPGLFYYGVHTIEMVDAIWGPGVARVRATTGPDRSSCVDAACTPTADSPSCGWNEKALTTSAQRCTAPAAWMRSGSIFHRCTTAWSLPWPVSSKGCRHLSICRTLWKT